jgi:Ca-activated chloride channel family protein
MKRILSGLLAAFLATSAAAQDASNTILVLDGSGSMWGQIDGVNKIVIAREVVGTLLDDFPADQNLGLTVYGHRERGNCADIETVVAPAAGTTEAIRNAVNGINPRGSTPMTDAIIAAAEALRFTEQKATVILVSDGIETCNPDPCAAATALEQAGIDFTAHVVGFDVTDPEALAQMQCLADNTGGTFTTAANAEELTSALQTVAVAPAPEPEPEPVLIEMTFSALIGDDARLIETPILWTIAGNGETLASDTSGNPLVYELPEGAYTATAYSVVDEVSGTAQFVAISGGNTAVQVLFEEQIPTARIIAPTEAPAGSTVQVGWAGPDADRDYVGVGAVGAETNKRWENLFYTRDGNPGELLMPTVPGDYIITYFLYDGRTPIGQAPITLTPVTGTITAPAEALVGEDIAITWEGPDYRNDYIGIGRVGAEANKRWENLFYTRGEKTQMLTMPTEPGDYEISYFFGQVKCGTGLGQGNRH